MDKVSNLQMSYFGSFENYGLNTEIVIKLLNALKDDGFVPGSFDIASIDIKTGKITVDNRMVLISPDKTWDVKFLPDRIDFDYKFLPTSSPYRSIVGLVSRGKELIEKVFPVLGETTGNRLSLSCRAVLEKMTDGDMRLFRERFVNNPRVYGDDPIIEWSLKYNSRGSFKTFENHMEESNRIIELKQVENDDSENDNDSDSGAMYTLMLTIDINTIPTHMDFRFDYENLKCFADDASLFINKVIEEM